MAGRNPYVLIDEGMFCAGMRLKAPIYYRYKGAYVLLCRNIVLSAELIQKLYALASATEGIYIRNENYEEVWEESLRQRTVEVAGYKQAFQQLRQEYETVVGKTTNLLEGARAQDSVSLTLANEITSDIAVGLAEKDQTLLLRCVNMIGDTDSYLYTHSTNVATLNGLIGKWMHLPEEDIGRLVRCGLVHDLGKLKVNPEVLNKPGCLTEDEFAEIKRHPQFSYDMLLQAGEPDKELLQSVRQHHEKPNGMGYPLGLRQSEITLFARITAVSDVYDAMVSARCYKPAASPFDVLALFNTNRFSGLDLEIVNIFLKNIAFLLVGVRVKLSTGEVGEVVFVPPGDYANPVVKVDGRIFGTTEDCKCIAAESHF